MSAQAASTGQGIDSKEKTFDVLMSEKTLADSQIGGAMDLNLKVLGYFGACLVLLGWWFSEKGGLSSYKAGDPLPLTFGVTCILLVLVSSAVVLQAVATYGVALGYIHYKDQVLGPALRDLLALKNSPLQAVACWRQGPARWPVFMASTLLLFAQAGTNVILLTFARDSFGTAPGFRLSLIGAWIFQIATWLTQAMLILGMSRVFTQQPAHVPNPGLSRSEDAGQNHPDAPPTP
jgi:hypothetical protein